MSIYDLLSSGNSLKEITEILFLNIDADGSGLIDLDEFRIVLKQIYAETGLDEPSDEITKSLFDKLDTDGSGEISMLELEKYVQQLLGS